jgi:hypothetical protein
MRAAGLAVVVFDLAGQLRADETLPVKVLQRPITVIGKPRKLPLLGTELLKKRKLLIDYLAGVVSID